MAKRLVRFERELRRTDRAVDAYVDKLENSIGEFLLEELENYNEANLEDDKEFILARLRSGRFPLSAERDIAEIESVYSQELENIKGRFKITEEDIDATQEIVDSEIDKVRASLSSGFITAATATFIITSSGGTPKPSQVKRDSLQPVFNSLRSGIGNNITSFRSAFEIRKAEEVDPNAKYTYVGPLDEKTRKFCRFVLEQGKDFTLAEIQELDGHPDAQITPVLLYGGGYGCRHRWIYTKRI